MMQPAHEYFIIIYINKQKKRMMEHYYFKKTESRRTWVTYSIPTGSEVVKRNKDSGVWLNPCQKPLALMDWIITHFSKKGDWVLDLCAGTGPLFFIFHFSSDLYHQMN